MAEKTNSFVSDSGRQTQKINGTTSNNIIDAKNVDATEEFQIF